MKIVPYHHRSPAEFLLERVTEVYEKKGNVSLAVPGGRSPGPVVRILAGLIGPALRKSIHLFWVDERAVPPGHPDRNDRSILEDWKRGGEAPDHCYPMPAEAGDLKKAALDYAGLIEKITGDGIIDVCLLGVGEDGHIASLFPDHPLLEATGTVLAVFDSPKPPPRRMTLSLPAINRAGWRIILAPGAEKRKVYEKSLRYPDPSLPVSLLQAGNTIWFVDNAIS